MIESYCTRDSDSGADLCLCSSSCDQIQIVVFFKIAMYSNISTNHPLVTIENDTGKSCAIPKEYFNNDLTTADSSPDEGAIHS